MKIKICTFLFILLSAGLFLKAQVFVKSDAQGTNDGTSWQNAYTNLDTALSKTQNGQIWVAKGTYKPSLDISTPFKVYKAFSLTRKVSLYGGFQGNETSINQRDINNNPTILSGDIGVEGHDVDNTPRVMVITGSNIDTTTLLDGFVVCKSYYTNGYDYGNGAIYTNCVGNPTIRNCTIRDNFGFYGGGIFVRGNSPLITNNIITSNKAFQGAGIYLDYASNARITGNKIINNRCEGGYTHLSGGGIDVEAYCSPVITNNLISSNYSGHYGGGICLESNYSVIVSNNIIIHNTSNDGGGVYVDFAPTLLTGNLIANNRAMRYGGGLSVDYSPNTNSYNNTIVNNYAVSAGSGAYLSDANMNCTNSIIYNNYPSTTKQISVVIGRVDWLPKFRYCDVENGKNNISITNTLYLDSVWRNNNIVSSPGFTDTTSYDYQINNTSACIDSGAPDTIALGLSPTDIQGTNRVVNSRIDMGCYEFSNATNANFLKVLQRSYSITNSWADSSFAINILSNTSWRLESSASWLQAGVINGTNNTSIPITAIANPGTTTSRSGQLLAFSTQANLPAIPILVNQAPSAYLFTLPDTVYFSTLLNDSSAFFIRTNLTWYLQNNTNWITVSKSFGSNNDTIRVKALPNNTTGNRIGIIRVVSTNPSRTRTVTLIQQPTAQGQPATLCPNGNTTLTTNLSGNNYQWQLNTGNGFYDLSNDSNYTGIQTNTLNINRLSSTAYGNKLRCIVDGIAGNVFSLLFVSNWTGAVNTAWENPSNWDCGTVPDSNTDVIISGGAVIVNSNPVIRSMKGTSNASIRVTAGFNLRMNH